MGLHGLPGLTECLTCHMSLPGLTACLPWSRRGLVDQSSQSFLAPPWGGPRRHHRAGRHHRHGLTTDCMTAGMMTASMTRAGMTTAVGLRTVGETIIGMMTAGMMTAGMTTAVGLRTVGETIVGMMTGMTAAGVSLTAVKLKPKVTGKTNYLFNPESSFLKWNFNETFLFYWLWFKFWCCLSDACPWIFLTLLTASVWRLSLTETSCIVSPLTK